MRPCSNCNRPPLAQLDLHQVERGDADEKCPDSNPPGQSRPWHAGTPLSKRPRCRVQPTGRSSCPSARVWTLEPIARRRARLVRTSPKKSPGKSPPLPGLSTKWGDMRRCETPPS